MGFAVSNKLENTTPQPINGRLMTCRIDSHNGNSLTLISAYAPTMQRTVEEKELFYENLGECIRRAKDDSILILGDFNARVGNDWQSWAIVMGKHGVGKMNTNELMLLEFCTRFQLIITGTVFQLKNHLKTTWMHMRSRHWHQLDHILANSKARVFVKITKASLTADCFTDHRLLMCKCKISAVKKKGNLKPPKKLDTTMTKERKEILQRFFQEKLPDAEADWKQLKSVLSDAAKHVFGKEKRKHHDWFDEHDEEIQQLLKEKKDTRKIHYLRDKIRQIKNDWFQRKAEEAEKYSQEKNHREFYAALDAVYGPRPRISYQIRSIEGELLSSTEDTKKRWVEAFNCDGAYEAGV